MNSGIFGWLAVTRDEIKPRSKVGWVTLGYVIALVVATAGVACHVIATTGFGMRGYSGMNAFGDALLFLVVFAVAAIPPTGAALFFLRPNPRFWRAYSVVALVFGIIGVAAFAVWAVDSRSVAAGLAFPGILIAPLCALNFLLSTLVAPNWGSRIALLVATITEAMVFASWVITCIVRNH
jgi:hypothetical protein